MNLFCWKFQNNIANEKNDNNCNNNNKNHHHACD